MNITRRSVLIGAGFTAISIKDAWSQDATAPSKTPEEFKLTPTEQFLYATVMISTTDARGQPGSGTASIFQLFNHNGNSVPVLVTNKHVVANATTAKIKFNLKKSDGSPDRGKTVEVVMNAANSAWINHPDPNVDLVVCPCAGFIKKLTDSGQNIFYLAADQTIVPTVDEINSLTPLEEVLIVGYPDGISDAANNIPVFRKGITATPIFLDFNGRTEFLVDAAIYPGSSGSPVFLFNQGAWSDKSGHLQLGVRIKLLGIVYAVQLHTAPGEIAIVPAPTQRALSLTQLPNNLGVCIKASRILDFEPEFIRLGILKQPEGYVMRSRGAG